MPCWVLALGTSGFFGVATLSCPFLRMVLSVRMDGVEVNANSRSQAFSNRAAPNGWTLDQDSMTIAIRLSVFLNP